MKRVLQVAMLLWLVGLGLWVDRSAQPVQAGGQAAPQLTLDPILSPTPTRKPTITSVATLTPTVTDTPLPTHTPMPTSTPSTDTNTSRPVQCTTRTRLDGSPLPRAWIFLMNFRREGDGCMIFYDRGVAGRILTFKPLIDACKTIGDVRYFAGKAFFRGGYIECDVNIRDEVNSIAPPESQITETAVITGFYMLGRGVITTSTPISPLQESVIVGYDPTEPGYSGVSIGMVVTSTLPNRAVMLARFNNNIHTHGGCVFGFDDLTQQQIWALTRPGNGAKLWVGSQQVCDISPRPYIELRQDGGKFYIGGHPNGFRFYGMLEEIAVDPYDGGRPPAEVIDDNTEIDPIFMPMLLR